MKHMVGHWEWLDYGKSIQNSAGFLPTGGGEMWILLCVEPYGVIHAKTNQSIDSSE